MPFKKNTTITQEVTGNDPKRPSYFMDKIFPALIGSAIVLGGSLIILYSRFESMARAVDSFPQIYVRQDVLGPQIEEINKKLDRQDLKLDKLLERN